MVKSMALILVLMFTPQAWAFYQYDAVKAWAVLEKMFYKDHFWMMPSDSQGQEYFPKKNDFKKYGKLRVVPVLKLSKRFSDFDYSKDIRGYFEPVYYQYCGLIYKGDKFLDVMFVDHYYNKRERLASAASLGSAPKGFHDVYKRKAGQFFYDELLNSFVFFEGDTLYVWSYEKEKFIGYFEKIESELGGLDALKKAITENNFH